MNGNEPDLFIFQETYLFPHSIIYCTTFILMYEWVRYLHFNLCRIENR